MRGVETRVDYKIALYVSLVQSFVRNRVAAVKPQNTKPRELSLTGPYYYIELLVALREKTAAVILPV